VLVKGLPWFTQLVAHGGKRLTTGAPNHYYNINAEQRSDWQKYLKENN